PFRDPDRLVRLETVRGGERGPLAMREVLDLRERTSVFTEVAAYVPDSAYTLSGAGDPEKLPAIVASQNLFRVLGVSFLHGGPWPEEFDRSRNFGIVLSHRVWKRKLGGDPAVVGRTVTLDASPAQRPSYTVFGVLPEGIELPAQTDLYRSLYISRFFPNLEDRSVRRVVVLARLRPGVSLEQAAAAVAALGKTLQRTEPATNGGVELRLLSLRESSVGPIRPYLLLIAGAVLLVLLIACVNVANLLLARALEREREIALRFALGAGRGAVLRQLLAESLLLSFLGGALGLLVAFGCLRGIAAAVRLDLPLWMEARLDGRVVAFTFLVAFLVGLGAGLLPAVRAGSGRLLAALQAGTAKGAVGGVEHRRLRAALVVVEVALSLMLLVGAGLLTRTFVAIWQVPAGFDPDGVLTFRLALPWTYPEERIVPFQRDLLAKVEALPGVASAALNTNLPLAGADRPDRGLVLAEGQPAEAGTRNPYVHFQTVTPGYFATLRIPLESGRPLGEEDREGAPRTAVIGHRLARLLWPDGSALGRRLRRIDGRVEESPWLTVVGIAGDVRHDDLLQPPGYAVYLSARQVPDGWFHVAVRLRPGAGRPEALIEPVRRAVAAVDPDQPVDDFRTLRRRVLDTVWRQRLAGLLFGGFALLALALAATGLYGVLAFSVGRRTREIGVRMALGAAPGEVRREVLGEALRLTGVGLVAGGLGALLLSRTLAGLLYGVQPVDPWTFAAVACLLAAVALVAGWVPARRAMRVDPQVALRNE
ncbi:MAG TPA: ABC transporter permease, partial [Acidobacteria bacterium]|nr:ABC transporter permease [Acidobacteriota bacterium]